MKSSTKYGITIGSVLTLIATLYSLVAYGIFEEIDLMVNLWGYNLSQLVFLLLISVGLGIIIFPVFTKEKSMKDVKSDLSEFMSQSTGATDPQLEHISKNLSSNLKNKLKINLIKQNENLKGIKSTEQVKNELIRFQAKLLKDLHKIKIKQVNAIETEQSTETINSEIELNTPIELNCKKIEKLEDFTKRRMKLFILFAVCAAIIYIITFILRNYGIVPV